MSVIASDSLTAAAAYAHLLEAHFLYIANSAGYADSIEEHLVKSVALMKEYPSSTGGTLSYLASITPMSVSTASPLQRSYFGMASISPEFAGLLKALGWPVK